MDNGEEEEEEEEEDGDGDGEGGEEAEAAAAAAAVETPDPCVAVRLVAAAAWHTVQERRVDSFPRVLALLDAVEEAAPTLVPYRHLAKVRLGLQAKVIMKMLQEEQPDGKIYDAIDTFFPERQPQPRPKATAQDLQLVRVAQDNFRDLVLGLLSNQMERKNYVQEHLENDYGEAFMHAVEELFHDYFRQLDSVLPEPHFPQLLEAACMQGANHPSPDSSILCRYLTDMGYPVSGSRALPRQSSATLHRMEVEGQRSPEPCKQQRRPGKGRRERRPPSGGLEDDDQRPQSSFQMPGNQTMEGCEDFVLDSSSEGDSSPFKVMCVKWRASTSAPSTTPSSPPSMSICKTPLGDSVAALQPWCNVY